MTIRGCIFDLGNTLAYIPAEFDEEECIARILGHPDTENVRSVIYRICDRYPNLAVEEFLDRFDKEVNPTANVGVRTSISEAWTASINAAVLVPGALDVLRHLKALGQRLALVTNTPPTTERILARLGLGGDLFDVIVMSCNTGFLKPDPRIFQIALDQLGTKPEETLVIGDKIRTDILGGAVLGLRSILVETRMRTVVEDGKNYVDAIVPSVRDIPHTRLFREEVLGAQNMRRENST